MRSFFFFGFGFDSIDKHIMADREGREKIRGNGKGEIEDDRWLNLIVQERTDNFLRNPRSH